MVDVSKLADPDDVKQDSFGIWKHSGSHTQLFKVYVEKLMLKNVLLEHLETTSCCFTVCTVLIHRTKNSKG